MPKFLMILLAAGTLLGLSACSAPEQDDLYTYLMLHPSALKSEIVVCQHMPENSTSPTTHCATVMLAADQMYALIEKQQKNPEKFGQDILHAQMELAKSDTQINQNKVKVLLKVVGLSSPE